MSLRIGYSEQSITPSLGRPVYLAGFGLNRVARSVHDDIYARTLVLSDGKTTLVLCALDLIGLFQADVVEVIDQVQEKMPEARVVIASTHNHHGPDTLGLWGPDDRTSGVDPGYRIELEEKILRTVDEALQLDLGVAEFRSASVRVSGAARNTRNPEIVDDELTCLQFQDREARPRVTAVIFSSHPQVMWQHNPHISSDYPGALRRGIEESTGAPCLFFSGVSGCTMPPAVEARSFEALETVARPLISTGLRALETAERQTSPVLCVRQSTFQVELTNIVFQTAMRDGLLPEMRDPGGCLTCEANLIQVGDCRLVTVPGELAPELGWQVKARLKQAGARVAAVVGLANDELGYILPHEGFQYPRDPFRPEDHLEEVMSVGEHFGPRLMEAIEKLAGQT